MKKSTQRILKAVLIPPIIFLVLIYILLAWYYKDTFSYGTWINGVYCTGKTIDEINEELIANAYVDSLEILLQNGEKEILTLDEIQYSKNYQDALQNYQVSQNPFLWVTNIFNKDGIQIQPVCTYSKELLEEKLSSFSFYKEQVEIEERSVKMQLTEEGYIFVDTRAVNLDFKLVKSELDHALISGKSLVNLYDEDVYYEIPYTTKDLETISLWEQIDKAQSYSFTYVFGEDEEIIDSSIIANWILVDEQGKIVLDEQGKIIIDEEAIDSYVISLGKKYNTYVIPREYTTVDGRIVSINRTNYGNLFDVEKECLYLREAYKAKKEEKHEPEYIKKALYQGMDDIGPDYIEIDITNQKMYCVFDGVLEYETDIVTGNVSAGMGTKDRICYIYSKQRNRILRGPGYESQVDYWMAIYGSIGIHDAKWRSNFGGTIYKKNGSHGCINTPRNIMPDIYEHSFVGMPVIIYE